MEHEWVQVWNCAWLHEAAFFASLLESAGIPSQIPDRYTVGVQPFYAPLLGGVRLFVRHDDIERASELLAAASLPTEPDQE